MKKLFLTLFSLFIIAGLLVPTGCGGAVTGSRRMVDESYDFTGFLLVEAGKGFELDIEQADSFTIEITCDDNIKEHLDIRLDDDILKLDLTGVNTLIGVTLRAAITMPALEGINLSEGASALVYGFSSDRDFSVTLSEGSRLEGTIETGDIGFGLSEGSQVNLTGSGNNLVARSSDGSRLMLDDFPILNADINIDGGGRAILNISGRLDTTLTGGSELEYIGNPEMGEVNVTGGSSLSKR